MSKKIWCERCEGGSAYFSDEDKCQPCQGKGYTVEENEGWVSVDGWVARDKHGIELYLVEPKLFEDGWFCKDAVGADFAASNFLDVKENEMKKVQIIIKEVEDE